ncbi:MAG TPA: hypothetical protein VGY32_04165 [Solirubrobacteraceae bacterium]|nr:hypothetical protein [Solirubrobacteraceae bacterium]
MSVPSLDVGELDESAVGRRPGRALRRRRRGGPRTWLRSDVVAGAGAVLLSLALAAWALRLWRADLGVPFRYSSRDDTLFYLSLIKAIAAHGWFATNHSLGAPFGQQLFDYPQSADNLNFLIIRGLTLVAKPAVVLNLFYLLTYPLDALAAFWATRRLGASRSAAVVCAVLFALLPYHLFRGDGHLFLSAYYALPLAAYLFVTILRGQALFERRGPPARGPLVWVSRRTVETVVLCAVIASGGLYYAVFSLTLVAAAVLIALLARRSRRAVVSAAAAWILIAAVLTLNLAPTISYQAHHGGNAVVSRAASAGDDLALSVSNLILPSRDDRIKPLRSLTRRYDAITPRQTYCEQCHEAMGLVGDVGFIWLGVVALGALVGVPLLVRRRPIYGYAAAGVGVCLAVGVTGGVSSLVRVFVTADIRAWNRISVLIAFFSLLASGLLLDALRRRISPGRRTVAFALIAAGVLAFGAIDQTNPFGLVPYHDDAVVYHSDQVFFANVQTVLPRGASVLELPYVPFPEGYQPYREPGQTVPYAPAVSLEYDQARGFINASALRFSYGAMKGRRVDWQSQLAAKPVGLAVTGAAAAGFQGLVVNLWGYPDQLELTRALRDVVGEPPFPSPFGDLLFYDLRPLARRLQNRLSAPQLAALRTAVLTPLRLSCARGQLTIDNPSPAFRPATLAASSPQTVVVGGVPAVPRGGRVQIPIRVAPGTTLLSLQGSPGAQLDGPTLVEPAFAPLARGPGSSILSGIVGPPCLNVPATAS